MALTASCRSRPGPPSPDQSLALVVGVEVGYEGSRVTGLVPLKNG